ncbi:hypothetical protein [Planobispora longispora]|uniref:Transposase n=1 Tax=Planobispora longispora TaxID=28887 RepID=A0A8J3RTT5_9ACTN|nr:hypothetical protein [Planobispora longispora]BFE82121.1 hypothetical protein GCM10020093_047220 [Planobispora longispora]GIH79449.1 hypothetical protein Plo01_58780 [Planobispora longispora]
MAGKEICRCFDRYEVRPPRVVRFHGGRQDTVSAAWHRLHWFACELTRCHAVVGGKTG